MSEKQQFLIQIQDQTQHEYKRAEYFSIKYLINEEEKTAGLFEFIWNHQQIPFAFNNTTIDHQIFIPRSIKWKTKEYEVTSILMNAFKFLKIYFIQFASDSKLQTIDKYAFNYSYIKSIKIPSSVTLIGEGAFSNCNQLKQIEIPKDSKLKTIEKNAFVNSNIESITIPSELIDLKEGWCCSTSKLTKIIVNPNNKRYCLYEDKLLLGKTSIEDNNYENLIFCPRNIKHIKIPNFIKHICSYSFDMCQQLDTIEIPEDSKLETIDKLAFSFSRIKKIRIPTSVTSIGEGAFFNCFKLERIEIPEDSKLKTIEKNAFHGLSIDCITIPSELVDLREGWCSWTIKITKVIVSPNNPRYCLYENKLLLGKTRIEENNYENLIFCPRNIKHVKIPNFIKHICSYSFDMCQQLDTIEIPEDSKLETIEKEPFNDSKIDCITIPSELVDLKEGWCIWTYTITKTIVSPNNKRYCLYEDKLLLGKTRIEENNYENLIFCPRNIKHVKIPNFIKHICSYSFNHCQQLDTIEIPEDSKLETIDKLAFSSSKIKKIRIPTSVTSIGEEAFNLCSHLERIEIPEDSKLQIIEKESFSYSIIRSITIPSSVTLIGEKAFSIHELHIIEINNVEIIPSFQEYFYINTKVILMIPVHF